MSNPAKQKGTRFESEVVQYLREQGIGAYRPAQAGFKDTGDVHGLDGITLQCKAYRNMTDALREGIKGAQVQAVNAGVPYGLAVIKKPRANIKDAVVALSLEDFARLYKHWL